jgi:hypothetical protein
MSRFTEHLGQLWLAGYRWSGRDSMLGATSSSPCLPYPFERQRYWVNSKTNTMPDPQGSYEKSRTSPIGSTSLPGNDPCTPQLFDQEIWRIKSCRWLVFNDACGGPQLIERLRTKEPRCDHRDGWRPNLVGSIMGLYRQSPTT